MNKNEEVTTFIKELKNPFKREINLLREIILRSNEKITESIKWSAPSFSYKGNMATFNLRSRKFVNLTFHKGAVIDDKTGLLIGDGKEARVMRFEDMSDIMAKKESIEIIVNKWIEAMDKKSS